MRQNNNLINDVCGICGGVDVADKALSEIKIIFGYGSDNDGDIVNIRMCGKCADKLYKIIQKERK